MILWRIAAATRDCAAEDLSGSGAARYPGRWNRVTEPVLYCACTRALAVLESAAHVDNGGLPLNRFLVEIQVPDAVWAAREEVAPAALAATWDAIPAGHASTAFGSAWLRSRRSPLLLVPSVIVPEERCVLVNPQHPLAGRIGARVSRGLGYDRLFRQIGRLFA